MSVDSRDRSFTRSGSRAAASGSRGKDDVTDLKQRMIKLDGEFKGLRAQITELWKHMDSSPLRKRGQEEQLQQLGNGLAAVQNGLASAQSGVTSAQNGVVSVQSRVQEEGREREGLRREFQQQQAEMRRQKEELQKHQKELQQHAKEIQKHAKELHLQTQLGLEDKRERHLPMQRLQAVSDDLHWFKRQVYDSGVLKPKIEVQEETPEPPVGSLDLNEHVYSAWLLIRLGFARVQKDQKMAVRDMIPLEEKPMSGFNSDEEPLSSRGSSFSDQEDIVLGIQTPEILPGQKGYFQVTTGWLLVVTFTSLLQLLALSNMFAYGLTHGNVCLDKPMNNFDWWILHLSKAGGTIMVGAFMAGDVMDTVNFLMVEILVEKDASPKAIFFLIWRIVVIVFVGITNAIIFIVSTTPDGVWLMITAISFITDLPHGMMHVARSGMLGHYISKTITEMNFNLCLSAEYPWWFKPVRHVAHLVLFGLMGILSGYAFLKPMQLCPEDGSDPVNIFYHWWELF